MRTAGVFAAALLAAAVAASPAAASDPAAYVNPFNGTEPGAMDFGTGGGAGNTFPGATLPFGMVQFSPDTSPGEKAFGGGYTYSDSRIKGFSLKHMSGPGCAAYQDIPITPTTQPIVTSPAKPGNTDLADAFSSAFAHDGEVAQPGFYRVGLKQAGGGEIDARLTATTRAGVGTFTFPRASTSPNVLINVAGAVNGTKDASVTIDPAQREISGSASSGQFCYAGNAYKVYFSAQFSRPFTAHGTWKREVLLPGSTSASDSVPVGPLVAVPIAGAPAGIKGNGMTAQTGAYVTLDTRSGPAVEVRVGVSFVSVENARANREREAAAGMSTSALRAKATRTWNSLLGRIKVRGGGVKNTRRFYTQLYHSLLHPSTFSDANGEYTGFDGRVRRARGRVQYADYSGWDTYRSQMPLVAMLAPKQASDMVSSLVAVADESGYLPKWSQANGHTHVMVGDPADPLIAGAYAFGARSFDVKAALAAMVKGASTYGKATTSPDYFPRQGLNEYKQLGYVPHEKNTDSVTQTFQPEMVWGTASTTLEYAVADFSISQFAAAACDNASRVEFAKRAGNWRNVFDPAVKLTQPRFADGSFKRIEPAGEEGFVEGNAAQYTLFVPHDPRGLFEALGGVPAARARLDDFFGQLNAGPASPHAFLGNEPTLTTPWLYSFAGQPYKAQDVVRRAMLTLYADTPGGMPGNDDLGSMASWWVLSALGLYPAVPGTDVLTIGTPLFKSAVVTLGGSGSRVLRIRAPKASETARYVRSLSLDGRAVDRPWLRFSQLRRGGRLDFEVSGRANARWAADSAVPSFAAANRRGCATR